MTNVHPLAVFRANQSPPMTQQDLATALGVDRATVCRWESGERKPDHALVPKISEKTGIPAADLRPDLADLMKVGE